MRGRDDRFTRRMIKMTSNTPHDWADPNGITRPVHGLKMSRNSTRSFGAVRQGAYFYPVVVDHTNDDQMTILNDYRSTGVRSARMKARLFHTLDIPDYED